MGVREFVSGCSAHWEMPKVYIDGPGTMKNIMLRLTTLAESSCSLGVRVF